MAAKDKILYIYSNSSTFVRKDIAFLSAHYRVKTQEVKVKISLGGLFAVLKQIFFLLGNLRGSKAVFVMFGGYHAYLPALFGKWFGKRVFIILGGTDCVSFPSIDYGTFRKPWQAKFTAKAYRLATRLVPVHETLMGREDHYYEKDSTKQGVHHFVANLKTPHTTIHNGYAPEKWDVSGIVKQPKNFITVAALGSPDKLILKGINLIHEVASDFPDCQFTVVGFMGNADMLASLPNLHKSPFVSPEELRVLLSDAQFYLQLSISEGFPNAICEAMLTECIPIGSRVAGIPDIIGDTGLLLEKNDADMLRTLLKQALALPDKAELGRRARQRIAEKFHISKREKAYLDLVENG